MKKKNQNGQWDKGIRSEKEKREPRIKKEEIPEGRKKVTIINLVNSIIAIMALAVSVLSLWNQSQYAQLEYQYKMKPQVDMQGKMGVTIQKYENGSGTATPTVSECKIQVLQKNNLRSAYLIHDNYEVEELELDDIENMLEIELNEKIEFNKPSMMRNGISYHYEFLLLEGLDDSYELFLIYLRSGKVGGEFGFNAISGAEIIELEKAHMDNEDYAGERELAQKYLEILESCEKYIVR